MTQDKRTGAWPNIDIGQILGQLQIPGVDLNALIERERANIQAVQQANRIAFEGWQGLMNRQAEMIREAMSTWQDSAGTARGEPGEALANAGAQAQQAMEKALANMRELAEMATRSQSEAAEVVRKRFEQNLQELRAQLTPKQ